MPLGDADGRRKADDLSAEDAEVNARPQFALHDHPMREPIDDEDLEAHQRPDEPPPIGHEPVVQLAVKARNQVEDSLGIDAVHAGPTLVARSAKSIGRTVSQGGWEDRRRRRAECEETAGEAAHRRDQTAAECPAPHSGQRSGVARRS